MLCGSNPFLLLTYFYYTIHSDGMRRLSIPVLNPLHDPVVPTTIVWKQSVPKTRPVVIVTVLVPMTLPVFNWPVRMRKSVTLPHRAVVRNRRIREVATMPNANRPYVLPNRNAAIPTQSLANGLRPVSILPDKSVKGTYNTDTIPKKIYYYTTIIG
jgi:hypothetical protein